MELEQMRQLDAIARYGTISAAANELHISQPSLSRSVHRLEQELGQELFTRSRNRAELNEAGMLAVEHARAILREDLFQTGSGRGIVQVLHLHAPVVDHFGLKPPSAAYLDRAHGYSE